MVVTSSRIHAVRYMRAFEGRISQTAEANPFEEFDLAVRQELPKLMISRMAGNDDIVKRCLNDLDFREIVFGGRARGIYETVTSQ